MPGALLTRLGEVAVSAQVQHQLALVGQGLGLDRPRKHLPALLEAVTADPFLLLVGKQHLHRVPVGAEGDGVWVCCSSRVTAGASAALGS